VLHIGKGQKEVIRPDVNPAIMIDCQGVAIPSDTGVNLGGGDLQGRFLDCGAQVC
jgi:hypothetical protein